ncbi:MAG: Na/Pi symporter, partial [candidate division WOR-3 bacterium]|nr:Na/Pi symporter [candidate division WOR-3 bacterium]
VFAKSVYLVKPVLGSEDLSGDNQVGEVSRRLKKPLIIQVVDEQGKPIAGKLIRFSVLSEPKENFYTQKLAQLSQTEVISDNNGYAETYLTFGGAPGEYCIRAVLDNKAEKIFSLTALPKRWYLIVILGFLGGLCFFLFGLYYGSKGLRRLAGPSLREIVFNLTRHRILGALVGILVTLIFQSSTATSVLLISFVSTGLIGLMQALAVILGADIGTTFTAQLLAFKLYDYALFIIIIGFLLMNSFKKIRDFGQALFGFGLVFFAIKLVFEASQPLKYFPAFIDMIISFENYPILGVIFAMIFTFLVHSSAATIGIAVGLAFSGLLSLKAAIPIILGANLGTSFSPLFASLKTSLEARRVALGHTIFKFIIVLALLPFVEPLAKIFSHTASSVPRQIANAHTLINLIACIVFLPLLNPFEKLLRNILPEYLQERYKAQPLYLDPTVLDTPAMALAQAHREVLRIGDIVLEMFKKSLEVFLNNDKEGRKKLISEDDQVDNLVKNVTHYLTKLPTPDLPVELLRKNVALLYIIDDLEHIGDIISKSLMVYTKKKIDYGLVFSDEGLRDIQEFHKEVEDTLKKAIASLGSWDEKLALDVSARREFGNIRLQELHNRHLARLVAGLKESIDTSTIHLDFISDLERINYHGAKIGLSVIQALKGEEITIIATLDKNNLEK